MNQANQASTTTIRDQLQKDVQDAGLLLVALPAGDELVGYQCTMIIRRGSTGQYDAVHAAVSSPDHVKDVGAAVRERTAASWTE